MYASYILFPHILRTNMYYIKYTCAVCFHTINFHSINLHCIILKYNRRDGEENNNVVSFSLAMLLLGVVLSQSFPMPFKGSFRVGLEVPRSDFQYKTCQCQRPKKPFKYQLYRGYMGLTITGTIPRVTPFSL